MPGQELRLELREFNGRRGAASHAQGIEGVVDRARVARRRALQKRFFGDPGQAQPVGRIVFRPEAETEPNHNGLGAGHGLGDDLYSIIQRISLRFTGMHNHPSMG